MECQFDDQPRDYIDPNTEYYCSTITQATGFTLLMKYCLLYHRDPTIVDTIRKYVKQHPHSLNERNSKGWTPLILSARNSHCYSSDSIVMVLIELGANINAQEERGWTALMTACRNVNRGSGLSTIQCLLEAKADVNIVSEDGSVLNIICSMCETQIEPILKMLIQRGIRCDLVDKYGYTALHDINNKTRPISVHQILLEAGIPINHRNNAGDTPLMILCRKHPDFNLISLYLDYEADLSIKDQFGFRALDYIRDPELKKSIREYASVPIKEPECL